MGGALSTKSHELFQLYVYAVSVVCAARPGAIFALYPYDERPRETTRARHDMEEGVHGFRLGIFPDGIKIMIIRK
jgi:hypothetical protein